MTVAEDTTNGQVYATASRPWLKYYPEGSHERVWNCNKDQTMWKFMENAMQTTAPDQDAFIYFGRRYSRREFMEMTRTWAKAFKGMGIRPDELVVLFSPFSPQIAAMLMALNAVGATTLMPNMGSSKEAINGSVENARFAICFDGMYDQIAGALERPQFEKVIIVSASTGMSPVMSVLAGLINIKANRKVMKAGKGRYITAAQALKQYGGYTGSFEEPFVPQRVAMITASGGTTLSGHAKLVQCVNESIPYMIESALASREKAGTYFNVGDLCLNMLPPFVSTSEFVLFLAPLFSGGTIVFEPRLSPESFADSNFKFKPQITLMPGKGWEAYFNRVEALIAKGRRPDLSHWSLPIIGGEGCTPEELSHWNSVMKECGAKVNMIPGYGMSEGFSVMSVDFDQYDYTCNKRDCIHVGRPFAGFTMAVFDKQGNELPAGKRGELWVKTPTAMKGYLGNPELTEKTLKDGWIHTGDLFEMDKDGEFFCYGRMQDRVYSSNGTRVFTFDVANRLRKDPDVRLAIVNNMSHGDEAELVAHLVLEPGCSTPKLKLIERLQNDMRKWMPEGLTIEGYYIHSESTFLTSPVMKTDKNHYKKITSGYLIVSQGKLKEVSF